MRLQVRTHNEYIARSGRPSMRSNTQGVSCSVKPCLVTRHIIPILSYLSKNANALPNSASAKR